AARNDVLDQSVMDGELLGRSAKLTPAGTQGKEMPVTARQTRDEGTFSGRRQDQSQIGKAPASRSLPPSMAVSQEMAAPIRSAAAMKKACSTAATRALCSSS